MNSSQGLKGEDNSDLYDTKDLVSGSGSVAFKERLIREGDTVYLYVQKAPSITGAVVTVTKSEESDRS